MNNGLQDSDYTLWSLLCTETHLGGELRGLFVFPLTAIACALSFAIHWQYSSQEGPQRNSDFTVMITIIHWCLRAKTHPCGKVVSAVIIFVFFSGCHYSNSMVITWCALISMNHKCRIIWAAFEQHLSSSWWVQTRPLNSHCLIVWHTISHAIPLQGFSSWKYYLYRVSPPIYVQLVIHILYCAYRNLTTWWVNLATKKYQSHYLCRFQVERSGKQSAQSSRKSDYTIIIALMFWPI